MLLLPQTAAAATSQQTHYIFYGMRVFDNHFPWHVHSTSPCTSTNTSLKRYYIQFHLVSLKPIEFHSEPMNKMHVV